ncbi:hypothetical protein GCM10010349_02370 [Streptomyces flavofungini]|nr:hypothetical protein GCM10010349_02370 [Streptomyces flavofungini]
MSAGTRLGAILATAARSASGVSSGIGISGPYEPSGCALTGPPVRTGVSSYATGPLEKTRGNWRATAMNRGPQG